MKSMMLCRVTLIALSVNQLHAQGQTDHSPHTVHFVIVEPRVSNESFANLLAIFADLQPGDGDGAHDGARCAGEDE